MAALAVIGFLLLNLVGFLRQSDYKNLGAFVDSTGDYASRFTENGADDVAFSLTNGEFAIPFETFPQVIRKFGSDSVPCKWGLTYLQAPLQIIPSVLWSDRPLPLANWYIKAFYGPGWQMNQGRQFFFLSEGYVNFGPIGVLLEMSFYGFLLGILGQYRKLNGANKGAIFLYAICLAFLPRILYADSTGLIVGLPEQFLLMSIIGLWIAAGFGRNKNDPGSRVTSPSPYVFLE